jgi:hypothetical protein
MFTKGYDVFLGGTTNNSKWRDEFLKLIKESDKTIKCFNPVVENWTPECIDLENFVKYHSKYHVYVLTPRMLGVYSIAEMCESVHDKTKNTYFYIKDDDIDDDGNDIKWEGHMKHSLAATANLLVSHGAFKADSMEKLVSKVVYDYKNHVSIREPLPINTINRTNKK